MEKDSAIIIDDKLILKYKGKEITKRILLTFDSNDNGKSYIVYTDDKKDDNGNIICEVGAYDSSSEVIELSPVTDEEELNTVRELIDYVKNNLSEKE